VNGRRARRRGERNEGRRKKEEGRGKRGGGGKKEEGRGRGKREEGREREPHTKYRQRTMFSLCLRVMRVGENKIPSNVGIVPAPTNTSVISSFSFSARFAKRLVVR
jgi:hypothetical protein